MISPYAQAFTYIEQNSNTVQSQSLAKMILSLSNDCGFAFSECIDGLGASEKVLCFAMCLEYYTNGRSDELLQIGQKVAKFSHSRLWDQGEAMRNARDQLFRTWRQSDKDEDNAELDLIEQHDKQRGISRSKTWT
jgi:hypothetical protein